MTYLKTIYDKVQAGLSFSIFSSFWRELIGQPQIISIKFLFTDFWLALFAKKLQNFFFLFCKLFVKYIKDLYISWVVTKYWPLFHNILHYFTDLLLLQRLNHLLIKCVNYLHWLLVYWLTAGSLMLVYFKRPNETLVHFTLF